MTLETSQLAIGIVCFVLGNATGYITHDVMKKSLNMNEESSRNFLIVTITIIWSISMIVDVLSATYDVPIAVHGLLGAIVGFFFYKPKQN